MKESIPTTQQEILKEVLSGLSRSQKELSSKLFYDERGSRLFDRICELEEYYPTRTESKIISQNIPEILSYFDSNSLLVELGSGSSTKTLLILDALESLAAYIPIDISEDFLYMTANKLRNRYRDLNIIPLCADYTKPFRLPDIKTPFSKIIAFYPGSTIGNFKPHQAQKFLTNISHIIDKNGGLLIGVDLKKDPKILESAYNDSQGITASFNLNILKRLNMELDADFNLNRFKHHAFYNKDLGRVEMHLVSLQNQTVTIQDHSFFFKKDESIHTENSYKYTIDEFKNLVSGIFTVEKVWTDSDNLFSLQYLKTI